MATLTQGIREWIVRSDKGTLLGYGSTPGVAIERAKRHPKVLELGAEVVIRENEQ